MELSTRPLAVAGGGPLRCDIKDYPSLAYALERAAGQPERHGVSFIDAQGRTSRYSYRQMAERVKQLAGSWQSCGWPAGGNVLLCLDDPEGFWLGLWACIVGGYVPVPMGVGNRWPTDEQALQIAVASLKALDPIALVTTSEFQAMFADAKARFALDEVALYTLDGLPEREPTTALVHHAAPERLAIIFPTSGSTGTPKPVTQTGGAILAMCAGSTQMNGFGRGDVFLNWMPMEHVGATVFLNILPVCVGAEQVHVAHALIKPDVLRWLDVMHRYRASVTWVPNYVFNMVVKSLQKGVDRAWDLSALRFLVNAGESITPLFSQRFAEQLEPYGLNEQAIKPAFGMSETCSGISWARDFKCDLERYISLGAPIPGAELRIVDRRNQPVEEGVVGRLHVRGGSVTRGYYKAGTDEKFLEDGWFDTGDSAYLKQGELYLTDRENDEIAIEGATLHSYELEGEIENLDGVMAGFTAVCGVELDGEPIVAAFYAVEPGHDQEYVRNQVQALLKAILKQITFIVVPTEPRDIPKTSIGKIQRKVLRRRAQQLQRHTVACRA